jgi:hypothetical protein
MRDGIDEDRPGDVVPAEAKNARSAKVGTGIPLGSNDCAELKRSPLQRLVELHNRR